MKTVINNTSISGENSWNHLQSRVRRATERWHVSHGWLDSYFSFSFAEYFDPSHIQFGALRVINDDVIAPNTGFGMHPHRDMEILTLPLSGHIEHEDSMGNISRIGPGQIQVMSAWMGIFHSERNPSQTEPVKLLQIWVFPNKKGVTPRYEEMNYVFPEKNSLISLVAPCGYKEEVTLENSGKVPQPIWLHQNVWFYLGDFEAGTSTNYRIRSEQNGLYLFVIEGSVSVNSLELHARDALELSVWDASLVLSSQEMGEMSIQMMTNARFLLIDVPYGRE
jgi:quercetin 2,3-dioxygenase